ncbi:degenerin deg-1-like [Lytechinus variegatus]|uniref:degenerin deg-1-like n=1 Tax=Lytechinus variegatus TaxID=7654 RepID=UPI001BB2BA29|nr:degenerin deg-1-like [Lytechinus variegatus]
MYGGENIAMNTQSFDKGPKTISQNPSDNHDNSGGVSKGGTKSIVDDFVDNATTHGIPRFLNSSRSLISRLFWCVVTLGLLGALLYQGSKLVIAFTGRPTTTKISLITESKLEFPSVTICNLNMMRRSKLNGTRFETLANLDVDHHVSGIGVDDSDYDWFFSSDDSSSVSTPQESSSTSPSNRRRRAVPESSDSYSYFGYDYDAFDEIDDPNDWERFYDSSTASDFSDFQAVVRPTIEELREYGHQAKDFILQCTFDTQPCSYRNFTVIQNVNYGNCFVFNNAHKMNRDISINTTRTGSQYGLHLTLMVEQPEYIGVLSPDSGVKVAINDPRIHAFPEDDGVMAPPGVATSIGLKKTTINRLGDPFGKCKNGHSSDYYQPEKYDFSQRSCMKMCLQMTMKKNCSCITDILINGSMCGAIDKVQVKCRSLVLREFLKNNIGCSCSNPCSETIFTPTISTSRWPGVRYEAHMYNRLANISEKAARILTDVEQSRNNLVRLRVFYEELNFENVQESPLITVETLFGGVGGLMGLYVGMSFISLMEILVFISELLRSLCCPKNTSKHNAKVSGH